VPSCIGLRADKNIADPVKAAPPTNSLRSYAAVVSGSVPTDLRSIETADRVNTLQAASAVISTKVLMEEDSEGFKRVVYKKTRVPGGTVVILAKRRRQPLIGMRNSVSLPIISKRERYKALFVSRFSPEVTVDDVEKFLKEQLSLKKLVCTRLKTKFNTYASFHAQVIDDEFPLINSMDVWPVGCLIAPFYGKLTPDQVHSSCSPIMGDRSVSNILHKERGGSPHPFQ
jgi:hypothetical protein